MMSVNDELLPNVDVMNSPRNTSSRKENIEVECHQEIPSVPWSELPPLAIDRICFFLSRIDRCSMSRVCRNWHESVSPSLWKSVTFYFPRQGCMLSTDNPPEVVCARKYGHFFQNVRVICGSYLPDSLMAIPRYVSSFLQALACRSKLLSISFTNLREYLMKLNKEEFEDHRQCLINALLAQNRLQSVQFQYTMFKKPVAVEILQSVFFGCSKTLEQLTLDMFMVEYPEDGPTGTTSGVFFAFETLMNLKMFTIDYSEYFVEIITSFYDYGSGLRLQKTGKLETLLLTCCDSQIVSYSRIQPTAWKYFREKFPALRIDLTIRYANQIKNGVGVFLVCYMPIRSLKILTSMTYPYHHVSDLPEIGSILCVLTECKINECLEVLNFGGFVKATNLAHGLVNFLQAFTKLRELRLLIHNPIRALPNQVNIVLEHWLKIRPMSLDIVHISVCTFGYGTRNMFRKLSSTYTPLLKAVGLNLTLVIIE